LYAISQWFIKFEKRLSFGGGANKSPGEYNFTKKILEEGLLVTVEKTSGRIPALYAFEPLMKLVRV